MVQKLMGWHPREEIQLEGTAPCPSEGQAEEKE